MYQAFRSVLIAFATLSLLASCDKDKNEPTPAQGSLSGTVNVQDEVGQPVAAKSGVTVTLEGGPAPISTTTDASGSFQFKNLPWGTYKAVYKRSDVGTWQEQDLLLNAQNPALTRTVKLGQLASTTVTSFSLSEPTSKFQLFTLGVNYSSSLYPEGFSCGIYMSTTADVSNTNYMAFLGGSYIGMNPDRSGLYYDMLKSNGFKSGDRVYVVAYGAPKERVSYTAFYADPTNSSRGFLREVITNLNPVPSPVLSFVMP